MVKGLILFFAVSTCMAKMVVGLVDMQRVLLNIKEAEGIRLKLEKTLKEKQGTLSAEEKKLRGMQESFRKQQAVMSAKAKGEKEKEMREKIMRFQEKTMKFQRELQGMERKLKAPLIKKVREVTKNISKSSGVMVTFEMGSSPVLFAQEERDLTNKVIEAYNKKYKK